MYTVWFLFLLFTPLNFCFGKSSDLQKSWKNRKLNTYILEYFATFISPIYMPPKAIWKSVVGIDISS